MRPAALLIAVATALAAPRARADDDKARFVSEQRTAMTVLAGWSLGSVAAGLPMWTSDDERVKYAGIQAVAWGAIDGAIATVGLLGVERTAREDHPAEHWRAERAKTARIFAINAALDVLYIVAGAALVGFGKNDAVRGTGAGIVAQGGFLLAFDGASVFVMTR